MVVHWAGEKHFLRSQEGNGTKGQETCVVHAHGRGGRHLALWVRKSSREVLLTLLEQDLIVQHDTENKVCPVLLALFASNGDDEHRAEAASIICKLSSVLSRSTVERLLLPRFCELCGDGKLFQIRKVCATNFGDLCYTVGQEATEKFLIREVSPVEIADVLLRPFAQSPCMASTTPRYSFADIPKFFELCSDNVWGM
ncbi:hypothetical protein MC885_012273 [Smutsia gigantea]|nr:hypothetical protein MC885_012273 [Smutsia gigantea]